MIREQTPKLISGVESVLRLLEDMGWRIDRFVYRDINQESPEVRLFMRHEPEKDDDVL